MDHGGSLACGVFPVSGDIVRVDVDVEVAGAKMASPPTVPGAPNIGV